MVAHVCDDLACRLAGAERVCADLERVVGPAGTPIRDGTATWLRTPCLGQCERPTACLVTIAGEAPGALVVGEVTDGGGLVETLDWAVELAASEPEAIRAELSAGGPDPIEWVRSLVPQAGSDELRLLARVGRVDPTSLDDTAHRRLRGARARDRDRAGGGHRRGDGGQAGRPRRRGVPDRAQMGGGRGAAGVSPVTSSATPTSRSPARSRTV